MKRTLVGACIGAIVALLALAAAGLAAGYTQGGEAISRPALKPGPYAALLAAFVYTAYFWPVATAVGAMLGGFAGLASWLARPARR
jgi:hypothetical protein